MLQRRATSIEHLLWAVNKHPKLLRPHGGTSAGGADQVSCWGDSKSNSRPPSAILGFVGGDAEKTCCRDIQEVAEVFDINCL